MTEELFRQDAYLRQCDATVVAVDGDGVWLDRTVFYPSGGGQPGDTGVLRLSSGRELEISDTRKDQAGDVMHVVPGASAAVRPGDAVVAEIDWRRRHRHMRMHSCLHLLCALVPGGVTGGSVGDGKGRLDFDLETPPDKDELTAAINRLIAEDRALRARWVTDDELAARPELVRTMSVKPPMGTGRVRLMEVEGVDLQPCGGTHVAATGEIGPVAITKIESKGKRNRRIAVAFADEAG
ncbi:MAG: alanyl-tRNA editing protein [Rhodospirillales bacterium]|nr:alanyl-tRNA editing protein [Rhodospirillales bacterium]